MAAEPDTVANPIIWQTPEEAYADFAREVQRRQGMTAEAFLRDLDAGRWDAVIDDPEYRDVLILALLADTVRPNPVKPRQEPDLEPGVGTESFTAPNPIIWTTREEEMAEIDRLARERLGMSGEAFLRDLDAGRWDGVIDDPELRDVLHLALLADVARS
jgi:hypothetical protein